MAVVWTAPRTWTTGELVTAAIMNTHIRDNENALAVVTGIIPAAGTTPTAGTGFTYTHGSVGAYVFTFSPAFPATPVVIANVNDMSSTIAACWVNGRSASGATIHVTDNSNTAVDQAFNFKAFLVV